MLAPVVIVFTKYDLLVLSRRLEEEWEEDGVDEVASHEPSTIDASEPFAASVLSLSKSMAELNTPTPSLVTVSGANFRCRYSFANVWPSHRRP